MALRRTFIRQSHAAVASIASAVFNIEHERSGSQQELEFQLLWTSEAA